MINDLGVDPYEWFDNPLDKMPIAKDEPIKYDNKYAPPEKLAELESMQSIESNPRPEEEIADEWFEANNKIEEETPQLFNQDSETISTESSLTDTTDDHSEDEDDLEIPAFLRRQKN